MLLAGSGDAPQQAFLWRFPMSSPTKRGDALMPRGRGL
jgi:hypothetical protein